MLPRVHKPILIFILIVKNVFLYFHHFHQILPPPPPPWPLETGRLLHKPNG